MRGNTVTNRYEDFTDLIMTSYRAIQKIKAAGMKKIHLKAGDVNCLYYLSRYPTGLPNSRLADLSGVDKAAVSRTLNSLMKQGYITLSPEDADKKYGKRYILTAQGEAAANEVNQKVESVVDEIGQHIRLEESEVFYKTFHAISSALVELSENV